MGKKKLAKKLAEMQAAEEAYNQANVLLKLDEIKTVPEKVRALVFAANEVLTQICENADKIKIDMFEEASDIIDIDKPRWKEFAKLAYKVAHGDIKESLIEKTHEKLHETLYVTQLKKSFFDTYVRDGATAKFVKKDEVSYNALDNENVFDSNEFEELLTDAVNVRHYLNTVLWPAFKNFGQAAFYITKGELEYKHFKDLVDWEHYKNGGYPSEKSKPKLWSIFDKFDYSYRLMHKYGFNQIDALKRQFGFEIELKQPSATRNSFSESGRTLSKYEIVRPICEDSRIKMKMLEEELGIFLSPTHFAIYDQSTRVIRRVINYTQYLDEIGNPNEKIYTTKGIKDSFDYLVLDDVSYPLYRELIHDIGCDEVLHPDGQDKPNHSLRVITHNEEELLGELGYYGNGQMPSTSQLPQSQENLTQEKFNNEKDTGITGNNQEETEE